MILTTALGPGSLFGLITFSHKIGLYDVQGPIPVVKNVFIHPESDKTTQMELEDVMPLLSFLAPVSVLTDFFFLNPISIVLRMVLLRCNSGCDHVK